MTALRAEASLLERWLTLRDRLLASARFQHWAAAFWPTRLVARRRARQLFDVCAGFVYSQVLLACVRLDLFGMLADGPLEDDLIARRSGLSPAAARRLLAAAASLELLQPRGEGRHGLGPLGAAMLGNPGIADMVRHHAMLYADLEDPLALLRGERGDTALSRYWAYAGNEQAADLDEARVGSYSALMSASQPLVAGEILDAYPLRGHRHLLDVGGGEATFLVAAAQRAPALRLTLFDLPPVAERARSRLAAAGLSARASAVGGNFFTDALPTGADVVSLVRVVHDHDDDDALALLAAVRRALPDDGVLLLAEPMSGTRGAEPAGDAYFGFYLLAMGRGRPRTPATLLSMLESAGFTRARLVGTRLPMQTRLIVARP